MCAHLGNETEVPGSNATGSTVDSCGLTVEIQERTGVITKYLLHLDTPAGVETDLRAMISFSQPVTTSTIRADTDVRRNFL